MWVKNLISMDQWNNWSEISVNYKPEKIESEKKSRKISRGSKPVDYDITNMDMWCWGTVITRNVQHKNNIIVSISGTLCIHFMLTSCFLLTAMSSITWRKNISNFLLWLSKEPSFLPLAQVELIFLTIYQCIHSLWHSINHYF